MINLDTKIDLTREVVADGPFDDTEKEHVKIIENIWAKKTRLLGREYLQLGLEHNIIPVNFIIRSRADVTEDMFVLHNDTLYNVVGFEELKDNPDYILISTVKKYSGVKIRRFDGIHYFNGALAFNGDTRI